MLTKSLFPLLFSLLFFSIKTTVQNDPTYDEFVGTVYKIPIKKVHLGYGKPIHDYEVIGEVRLPELNIPERQDSIKIPGVPITKAFGIFFKTTMHIPVTGKYAFALNSDDGSILWIGNEQIIDNDKPHKMKNVVQTKVLKKGDYPISIWYYQAYPDRYGLIFDSKYMRVAKPEELPISPPPPKKEVVVLTEKDLNFASNSYEIDEHGTAVLEKLATDLAGKNVEKINISGHTDNVGSEENNLLLSQKRAQAVADFLKEKLSNSDILFEIAGKGESQPIDSNDSEEGRSKNRRVELKIDSY